MLTFSNSEEEDPDDFPFPLTLKQKKGSGSNSGPASPGLNGSTNGIQDEVVIE
jgi:glycogen synthase